MRAPLEGPVTVAAAGRQLEVRPVDVSATGIAVRTPHAPPRGTYMRVGFALKRQRDGGPARWFEADGVVARIESHGEERLVALEFQVIEGHVAAEIQHYVREVMRTEKDTGEYAPARMYPRTTARPR